MVVFAVVVIIAIGAVAFIAFASQSTSLGATTSSVSTPSSTSGSSSTISTVEQATESNSTISSSSGLELRVDLNSTAVASGGSVAAQITLFNSLDRNLSLAPSQWVNSTLADWNNYDSFSGGTPLLSMVGYALFQGSYSAGNISLAGSPLKLAPSVNVDAVSWSIPSTITFLPDSDSAALYQPGSANGILEPMVFGASTESCLSSSTGAYLCGGDSGLSGYWNTTAELTTQQASLGSPFFRYFPASEYTLAVQDMWNQTIYAHFQILSSQTTMTQTCGLGVTLPGVSVVTSDGVQICVVGPSIVVNPNGMVDFRNGTVVDLHANLTGAATIGDGRSGGRNDTVILPNGTRFIFNGRGVIEIISPYQGTAVYSNGTVMTFPICQYPFDPDLQLGGGLSGNGTAWWTSSSGTIVSFYPNGSCSES
jgi:hypothetical protein